MAGYSHVLFDMCNEGDDWERLRKRMRSVIAFHIEMTDGGVEVMCIVEIPHTATFTSDMLCDSLIAAEIQCTVDVPREDVMPLITFKWGAFEKSWGP